MRLAINAALIAALWFANHVLAAPPYVDNGDGTVTDTSTGLMWDQCALGLSEAGCATGTATVHTWENAIAATATQNTAKYKGYSDWRLPSVDELQTLIKAGGSPTIDTTAFPNTPPLYFWSGSSYAPDPATFAWFVFFDLGSVGVHTKPSTLLVRFVRGGQYFGSFALLPGGIAGITPTTVTLTATSPVGAYGHWLAIPRGATAPTPAQVVAGVDYNGVTVKAGNGTMTAKTPTSFGIAGLAAGAAYDLYLVAVGKTAGFAAQLVGPIQFATTAIATRSIVIDPASPTTLYAGLDGAGVYKKLGAGNWTASSNGLVNLNVRALALKDSNTLYAATYGGGIYKSVNAGVDWTACAGQPANLNLLTVVLDPAGTLYAGSEAGVIVSADGCATWSDFNTGLPN